MKFLKQERGRFIFHITQPEREILLQIIQLYPLIPAAHHQLSKSEHRPDDQQLLEESLAGQRKKNRHQVQVMLKTKSRFRETDGGFVFSLSGAQIQWLLQVINDVRVGSWLRLGSPDGPAETFAALNEKTAPLFWTMEVAGEFQMILIKALNGDG